MKTELWNGHQVRFVDRNGEWWAVAVDVCTALGIVNLSTTLANFPENEILKLRSTEVQERKSKGGASSFLCVSEPGLYRLIFQSRKPEAEAFKTWVFGFLKSLREALGYEQYRAMAFAESARRHHIDMDRLKGALKPQDKVPYVKAHAITNKCIAGILGESKSIGKDELKAAHPDMVPLRDEILAATAELMAANEKFGLGLSVSGAIYGKFGGKLAAREGAVAP